MMTASALGEEPSSAEAVSTLPMVRVAIYDHSAGKAPGPKSLLTFLTPPNGFQTTILTPGEIQQGALTSDFDVLIMPGGSAGAQARNLEEEGRDQIRRYVREGGGYVGICAGAYLSTTYKPWSLGLVNAKVWDLSHWARGTGIVTLNMTPSGCSVLRMPKDQVDVYYGQGPMLVPGNDEDMPGYEILASYATEVAKKGAPEGAMVDMHAIIRTMYGKGRVIAYSPHPEKEFGPKSLMAEGVRWAGRGDE
ncbi:BPL-N domain-containing protein [Bremerella sp. JC770]|uniref:BPL-N domain-containing protein n=1 Tax=Bremerella sp. JC770 TaxID=3232137 RepID=UPI003459AB3D